MLPTPSRPTNLPSVELTANAESVFMRRYARRGLDGNPIEQIEDTFWRVAYHVGKTETAWGQDEIKVASKFYELLGNKRFFREIP